MPANKYIFNDYLSSLKTLSKNMRKQSFHNCTALCGVEYFTQRFTEALYRYLALLDCMLYLNRDETLYRVENNFLRNIYLFLFDIPFMKYEISIRLVDLVRRSQLGAGVRKCLVQGEGKVFWSPEASRERLMLPQKVEGPLLKDAGNLFSAFSLER